MRARSTEASGVWMMMGSQPANADEEALTRAVESSRCRIWRESRPSCWILQRPKSGTARKTLASISKKMYQNSPMRANSAGAFGQIGIVPLSRRAPATSAAAREKQDHPCPVCAVFEVHSFERSAKAIARWKRPDISQWHVEIEDDDTELRCSSLT